MTITRLLYDVVVLLSGVYDFQMTNSKEVGPSLCRVRWRASLRKSKKALGATGTSLSPTFADRLLWRGKVWSRGGEWKANNEEYKQLTKNRLLFFLLVIKIA
jgi:hypothetical protein